MTPEPERIQRLIRLLGLLQGGRSHSVRDLAEMFGVVRRTIFRDLVALRSAGVPVVYDDTLQKYSVPTQYFLAPTQFTSDEAMALVILCHELGMESRIPFLADARSAAVKVESTFPERLRQRMRSVAHAVSIHLATVNPLAGHRESYKTLIEAIATSRAVRFQYTSYADQTTIDTKFHPYRILFHQHSWFTIGRSSHHREVRTFNIGRIAKMELIEEEYTIPRGFTLERHFGNAWRMIPEPGPDHAIRIRFGVLVARNVAEVLWHPTQRTHFQEDGTMTFEVTVSGLKEISWWILGYGREAEVLHPPELREIITNHLRDLAAKYAI